MQRLRSDRLPGSVRMAGAAIFLSPEWEPLKRFSIFHFGSPIHHYLAMGENILSSDVSDGATEYEKKIRGKYYSYDASCYVEAACDLVHQITTYECCCVQGLNIIGSKMGPVLSLLKVSQPKWYVPFPHCPAEKVTLIPTLGLELVTSLFSGNIMRATMRPSLMDYANNEDAARLAMGNVVDIRQARHARRAGGRIDIPPYRPFDDTPYN